MDSPFFTSRLNAPSRPPYYSPGVSPVPVQNQTVHPPRAVSRAPKVVTIPVHFVDPERDRSGSALKIQKVFRGFLVRKSVRKIAAVRREVEEIERKVSDQEAVKLMRRDSREKLRVSEMLMNVLFRLDSVRGVDSGVRDFRKAVIKRAITLQEKVDEIVAVSFEAQTAADADRGADVEGRADGGREAVEEVAQVDEFGAGEPIPSSQGAARVVMDDAQQLEGTEGNVEYGGSAHQKVDESAGEAECLGGGVCDGTMIDDQVGGGEAEMCSGESNERMEENKRESVETGAGDDSIPLMGEFLGEAQPESQLDSTSNPQSFIEAIEENTFSKDGVPKEEEEEEHGCGSGKDRMEEERGPEGTRSCWRRCWKTTRR